MGWRSVQESNKRVKRLWFLPERIRRYYRSNRSKCSCIWCSVGGEAGDRRDKERVLDEIEDFWQSVLGKEVSDE